MQATVSTTRQRPAQVLGAELMAAPDEVRVELGIHFSLIAQFAGVVGGDCPSGRFLSQGGVIVLPSL